MNIILLENIEKVGLKYEVVTVKAGYGRNYLIPQGLALTANRQNLGKLSGIKRQQAAKDNAQLSTFQAWAKSLEGKSVTFVAKAGGSGRLFGSITQAMLADKLAEIGVPVERRRVIMPAEVKQLGEYEARLDLHPSLDVRVPFEVVTEETMRAQAGHMAQDAPKAATAAPAAEEVPAAISVAAPAAAAIVEAAPVVEEAVEAPAPVEASFMDKVEDAVDSAAAFAAPHVETAKEAVGDAVDSVKEFAAPHIETATEAVSDAVDSIKEEAAPIMEKAEEVMEDIAEAAAPMVDSVKSFFSDAVDSVKEMVDGTDDSTEKKEGDA